MVALLVFMLTSLEIVVERKNFLRGELYFVGCNVIQNFNSDIYFSYPCG